MTQERSFFRAGKEKVSDFMKHSEYDCPCLERCPLHEAMRCIGGKWKAQILCALAASGSLRYNALRRKLDGVSNTVLAQALRELEADGLIRRTEYLEVPVRVEYTITENGKGVIPILDQLSLWVEQRWKSSKGKEK